MNKQTKPVKNKLYLYWQAETVRLLESEQGSIDDNHIKNLLNEKYKTFDQRILYRANLLGKQKKIGQDLSAWLSTARISVAILWLLAFISGIGVAAGVLAQPRVNLASALIALLGLHLISFIIWLGSFLPTARPGTGLSAIWLWLNKKLGNKKYHTPAGQAFLSLFMRHKLWAASIGIITNSTWLAAFTGALLTMLIMLSTRNYSFYWATTLLSADTFITISKIIGSLPAVLGFPLPDDSSISASLASNNAARTIQTQWSVWLIGCVIVWGLLPRLLALAICLFSLSSKVGQLKIDPGLPGWQNLRSLYNPHQQYIGVDRPAGKIARIIKPAIFKKITGTKSAILGHELNPETVWPPEYLSPEIMDLGISSSRHDLSRIRAELKATTPLDLLVVCNTALTPDRGTLTWLLELQELAASLKIYCPAGTRTAMWQKTLAEHDLQQVSSIQEWQAETGQQVDG